MLGTVVNNKQLISLQKNGVIRIHPFSQDKLKTIHYPLTASAFLACDGREAGQPKFKAHSDFKHVPDVEFKPNEYLLVEIKETIVLLDGVVGHFVPSSKLIDYGFTLTCGRIEAPYGEKGEIIRFGISNQLPRTNKLKSDEVIAYVYFIDLRALSNLKVDLSPEEEILFRRWQKLTRYASDSGIHPRETE